MHKLRAVLVASLLSSWAGLASAGVMSWTDLHDPQDFKMSGSFFGQKEVYSWTFDLTDDGFDAAVHEIFSYRVELKLYDDSRLDFLEVAWYTEDQAAWWQGALFEINAGKERFGSTASGLLQLNADGTLGVSLTATQGDFYFAEASLKAKGKGHEVEVPEPTSLALLGLGIVALGIKRRSR